MSSISLLISDNSFITSSSRPLNLDCSLIQIASSSLVIPVGVADIIAFSPLSPASIRIAAYLVVAFLTSSAILIPPNFSSNSGLSSLNLSTALSEPNFFIIDFTVLNWKSITFLLNSAMLKGFSPSANSSILLYV